jgi:Relaxase/Mobilisation nuclease domain
MIINGGSRRSARFFAKHLSNADTNERVRLCEIRNLAAQTIQGALREMEAITLGSQCVNFFYHVNINPVEVEQLTEEQWREAVNLLEENLGLKGHARFVVEHRKKNRTHRHVIWLRIDVRTMRAVRMTDDYKKHQATARELERRFALRPVSSVLGAVREGGSRPPRRAKSWETFRGQLNGIDPHALKKQITAFYRESPDGTAFAARLTASGYGLKPGERASLCIIDSAGHLHSLARRIDGIDAPQLMAFMRDVSMRSPPHSAVS